MWYRPRGDRHVPILTEDLEADKARARAAQRHQHGRQVVAERQGTGPPSSGLTPSGLTHRRSDRRSAQCEKIWHANGNRIDNTDASTLYGFQTFVDNRV